MTNGMPVTDSWKTATYGAVTLTTVDDDDFLELQSECHDIVPIFTTVLVKWQG
jgi:hypothetical protein